jgi:hypothetical protein
MSSYSASVYSVALPQAAGNSFAPGGSTNAVGTLQDSLITIHGFHDWSRANYPNEQGSTALSELSNHGPFYVLMQLLIVGKIAPYEDRSDEEFDDMFGDRDSRGSRNYDEIRHRYDLYFENKFDQYVDREKAAGRLPMSAHEFYIKFHALHTERDKSGTIDTMDPADYEGYALNGQARRKMIRLSDLFDVNEYSSADNHGEGTAKPAQASSPWDNMFVFGSGGYRNQDVDSVGATPGSETDSIQGSIGIATMLSTELTSGISLTIADSDSEADTTTFNTGTFVPFESDARSTTFSLFTTFSDLEGYNFSGAYSYTHTSTDMIRRTAFNDIGGGGDLFVQANADDVDSGTHNFSLSGSYTRFEGSGWMWGPNASLSFGFGETDAYTETGGGTNVNLSVGESEYSFWSFTAGVHGSKYFKLSDNAKQKTLLNFGANWVHTDSETDNDVLITQVDTGVTTTRLAGTEAANKPGDDYLQLSLGLNHNIGDRTRLGVSHSMELLRNNSFAYFFGLNFSHVWD